LAAAGAKDLHILLVEGEGREGRGVGTKGVEGVVVENP
jgi:hypothetical protein